MYNLPSYNEQEQQKIMNSYKSGIVRFYGNATHELGRIGSSTAINMVAPYVGSTMYYGKMFMDKTNNAASEGYDTGSVTLYGLVNTGWEYAVGKLLGSATKGLTVGKSSGYEEFLEKSFNKLLGKFVQEYLDNFDKLLFLEKNKNPKDYISILKDKDIFADAVYSAAVGGVTGGIIGTLSTKNTNVDNQDIYKTFKEELEQTKQETTNSDTVKRINELINRIDSIENSDNNLIDSKENSKNTFENKGNKILVTNSGIEESINKIFNSSEQKSLLNQHLKVFSDLGDIIEHATLYDFEFDVRSMNDGTNQYRVQRLKENQQKKLMPQSRASTNNNVNTDRTFEVSISENNISQFDNNVKLSNINNIDMQNNQINTKKS